MMHLPDLNYARLDDITGGDPAMNGELVRIVVEDAASAIDALALALDARDADAAASRAHQLKGMCANVGAERLSEAALRVERAVGAGEWSAALALSDDVAAAFATLQTAADDL